MKESIDLRGLARMGAERRIQELRQELETLLAAFPEFGRAGGRGVTRAVSAPKAGRTRGRRRPMSAAERAAVSARMRKYWAGKRAGTSEQRPVESATEKKTRKPRRVKGSAGKRAPKTA